MSDIVEVPEDELEIYNRLKSDIADIIKEACQTLTGISTDSRLYAGAAWR